MLVVAVVSMSLVVPQPVRGAWDYIELVPSQYTESNEVYVPGENLDIVLHASTGELYDVFVVIVEENPIALNVQIAESDTVKVTYNIDETTPDGNYTVRVKLPNGGPVMGEETFSVQGYAFFIETDREAYLGGDEVKIFWAANNLKDRTLPPPGYGTLRIWNDTLLLYQESFNNSAGSISYVLPAFLDPDANYWVDGWFNDSYPSPGRKQYSRADFKVKYLGVIVDLDRNQYTVGSLLKIFVKTVVTDNQGNPSMQDTAEPGCTVSISIKNVNNQLTPIYQVTGLLTDSHGLVEHIILLTQDSYSDGSEYIVDVVGDKGVRRIIETTNFEVASSSSLTVVLDFNRAQYSSGETMLVNASASAIGESSQLSFTYIIEIRDSNLNGTLFLRRTQSSGEFTFDIPSNFEGWLWLRVTADDGRGNSAFLEETIEVAYAIVLVNVNNENYLPEQEVSVSYEVISSMMSNPSTFYVITDNEGHVVKEGIAESGGFTFTVPAFPSKKYIFTVFASKDGRIVQGYDTAELFSGYVLLIDFNKNSYAPGDTMAIDYEIVVLGGTNLPATFTISYGLANGPQASLQSSSPTGRLLYTIPVDINEGSQLFWADCDFGANANQVVTVERGANPLWYLRIGDIPIFDIFLLLLVILCLVMTLRYRRRLLKVRHAGEEKEEVKKKPAQESSSIQVQCVECGKSIEVLTSRRPIEVMCPHCGEIQQLEK